MTIKAHTKRHRNHISLWSVFAVLLFLPQFSLSQDQFYDLYPPTHARKLGFNKLVVSQFDQPDGLETDSQDSMQLTAVETYMFREDGRVTRFEQSESILGAQGAPGPHKIVTYKHYVEDHRYVRKDSFPHGRENQQWYLEFRADGKPLSVQKLVSGQMHFELARYFEYDPKGHLAKIRLLEVGVEGPDKPVCTWTYVVKDNFSFNESEMARSDAETCGREYLYLDYEGRPLRKVRYDAEGKMARSLLITYDRRGNPEALTLKGRKDEKAFEVKTSVIYDETGRVTVVYLPPKEGYGMTTDLPLHMLTQEAIDAIVAQWTRTRILKEIRVLHGDLEKRRYIFDYKE